MARRLAIRYIRDAVEQWTEGTDWSQLEVSAWRGELVLSELHLRKEALEAQLCRKIHLRRGRVGRLAARWSWARLLSTPVRFEVEGLELNMVVEANELLAPSSERAASAAQPQARRRGWISRAARRITDLLQITVSSVSVRMEVADVVACGIVLGNLSLRGEPKQRSNNTPVTLSQELFLAGLSVTVEPGLGASKHHIVRSISGGDTDDEATVGGGTAAFQPVVEPMSLHVTLLRTSGQRFVDLLGLEVIVELEALHLHWSHEQYLAIMHGLECLGLAERDGQSDSLFVAPRAQQTRGADTADDTGNTLPEDISESDARILNEPEEVPSEDGVFRSKLALLRGSVSFGVLGKPLLLISTSGVAHLNLSRRQWMASCDLDQLCVDNSGAPGAGGGDFAEQKMLSGKAFPLLVGPCTQHQCRESTTVTSPVVSVRLEQASAEEPVLLEFCTERVTLFVQPRWTDIAHLGREALRFTLVLVPPLAAKTRKASTSTNEQARAPNPEAPFGGSSGDLQLQWKATGKQLAVALSSAAPQSRNSEYPPKLDRAALLAYAGKFDAFGEVPLLLADRAEVVGDCGGGLSSNGGPSGGNAGKPSFEVDVCDVGLRLWSPAFAGGSQGNEIDDKHIHCAAETHGRWESLGTGMAFKVRRPGKGGGAEEAASAVAAAAATAACAQSSATVNVDVDVEKTLQLKLSLPQLRRVRQTLFAAQRWARSAPLPPKSFFSVNCSVNVADLSVVLADLDGKATGYVSYSVALCGSLRCRVFSTPSTVVTAAGSPQPGRRQFAGEGSARLHAQIVGGVLRQGDVVPEPSTLFPEFFVEAEFGGLYGGGVRLRCPDIQVKCSLQNLHALRLMVQNATEPLEILQTPLPASMEPLVKAGDTCEDDSAADESTPKLHFCLAVDHAHAILDDPEGLGGHVFLDVGLVGLQVRVGSLLRRRSPSVVVDVQQIQIDLGRQYSSELPRLVAFVELSEASVDYKKRIIGSDALRSSLVEASIAKIRIVDQLAGSVAASTDDLVPVRCSLKLGWHGDSRTLTGEMDVGTITVTSSEFFVRDFVELYTELQAGCRVHLRTSSVVLRELPPEIQVQNGTATVTEAQGEAASVGIVAGCLLLRVGTEVVTVAQAARAVELLAQGSESLSIHFLLPAPPERQMLVNMKILVCSLNVESFLTRSRAGLGEQIWTTVVRLPEVAVEEWWGTPSQLHKKFARDYAVALAKDTPWLLDVGRQLGNSIKERVGIAVRSSVATLQRQPATRAVSAIVAKGQESRSEGEGGGYRFGDFTRGSVAFLQEKGRQARGAASVNRFGDIAAGVMAASSEILAPTFSAVVSNVPAFGSLSNFSGFGGESGCEDQDALKTTRTEQLQMQRADSFQSAHSEAGKEEEPPSVLAGAASAILSPSPMTESATAAEEDVPTSGFGSFFRSVVAQSQQATSREH
eukprot:TRINITY_DN74273_c0_g1_i1.p1 TRINITY_DN74273_c0_g1~~TRINITY_DN74273_c0_g1_i1.p1  ORF type:complete len:1434 (-),score=266.16 TRINITY_DN74273_c0_g1_i1:87-4388(-)